MTRAAFLDMISNAPNARYDIQDQWNYIHSDLKWDEVESHLPSDNSPFLVVVDFGTLEGHSLRTLLQYYGKGDIIEPIPGKWWWGGR